MNFVQTAEFGKRNIKFAKKILKNHLLRRHKGNKAETLQIKNVDT